MFGKDKGMRVMRRDGEGGAVGSSTLGGLGVKAKAAADGVGVKGRGGGGGDTKATGGVRVTASAAATFPKASGKGGTQSTHVVSKQLRTTSGSGKKDKEVEVVDLTLWQSPHDDVEKVMRHEDEEKKEDDGNDSGSDLNNFIVSDDSNESDFGDGDADLSD